ncbi:MULTISPECIES: SDR family oxidoreductase [Tsukamurella]|uniref:SDR family oxidoreductase n=2 Tax=Tsukamurella TaxID=2060 RepID=A0A5C5S5G8_9ACTN|nr:MULTISPECIES: SDR family oxidoreductase [Tsukamurella]NMD56665.1 SDR family oxidoreductase [Tsukamurella columbiensis]TWS30324.1 SDR family oxidoreductase [Tsukamurella conjunctivitidis]
MTFELRDRTVVLIGGASGIGLAVARRVIADGARVVLGGRSQERLDGAVAALGPAATGRTVDTADPDGVEAFFAQVDSVDALFTTAATYTVGSFVELDVEEARSPFESKFWGQYRVVKAALPALTADAAVVLTSGAASVRPAGPAAPYVAANAAIEGLARGLAVELAPVRVNAIAPGTVDGNLWAGRPAEAREAAFAHIEREAVLGRPGTEDEIAAAVVHLFTSTYTTGSTLYVDGGYALR